MQIIDAQVHAYERIRAVDAVGVDGALLVSSN